MSPFASARRAASSLQQNRRGVTSLEYAMLAALLAAVLLGAGTTLSTPSTSDLAQSFDAGPALSDRSSASDPVARVCYFADTRPA